MTDRLVLYDYWRSGAGYRTRIALNLKGLAYERRPVDLTKGQQREPAYMALSPQGLVPALIAGEQVLTQSMAILEWLEETYPAPPLLPPGAADRAAVRAMALLIAADTHPLSNLRVLQALRQGYGADETQVQAWIARWTLDGFAALERMIERHGGGFAFGDTPSFADCCLAPQVYTANRFGVDISGFPRILDAYGHAAALDAFAAAHPDGQSDAASGPAAPSTTSPLRRD